MVSMSEDWILSIIQWFRYNLNLLKPLSK
jgi:hypothetical protein